MLSEYFPSGSTGNLVRIKDNMDGAKYRAILVSSARDLRLRRRFTLPARN